MCTITDVQLINAVQSVFIYFGAYLFFASGGGWLLAWIIKRAVLVLLDLFYESKRYQAYLQKNGLFVRYVDGRRYVDRFHD